MGRRKGGGEGDSYLVRYQIQVSQLTIPGTSVQTLNRISAENRTLALFSLNRTFGAIVLMI